MKRAPVLLALSMITLAAHAQLAVPPENDPDADPPPPRPPVGETETRARELFDAIVADEPERARRFFFPRDPFLILKGIANPGGYWDRLYAHYERDIHELHATIPEGAAFERFAPSRRGGWVARREEANALPYWAMRHSFVHYRAGDREQRFEIRTLINWGPDWYVTHLR